VRHTLETSMMSAPYTINGRRPVRSINATPTPVASMFTAPINSVARVLSVMPADLHTVDNVSQPNAGSSWLSYALEQRRRVVEHSVDAAQLLRSVQRKL